MTDCDAQLIGQQVARVAERLMSRGMLLACAESCTGGWVAKACTDLPGSSRWFERGFVTYTNAAKREMLGVDEGTLERFGAVSEQTVREMAAGALRHSHAQVSLAISGIAGPGGASEEKPLGTVCFAWVVAGQTPRSERRIFVGDREAVRCQAVTHALEGVLNVLAG
jgi:nicotinamide-nucleotide amidase